MLKALNCNIGGSSKTLFDPGVLTLSEINRIYCEKVNQVEIFQDILAYMSHLKYSNVCHKMFHLVSSFMNYELLLFFHVIIWKVLLLGRYAEWQTVEQTKRG